MNLGNIDTKEEARTSRREGARAERECAKKKGDRRGQQEQRPREKYHGLGIPRNPGRVREESEAKDRGVRDAKGEDGMRKMRMLYISRGS